MKKKVNKIPKNKTLFDCLVKLGDRVRYSWIFISPKIVEELTANSDEIRICQGKFYYIFHNPQRVICMDFIDSKQPVIKKWNLIYEIKSHDILYGTVKEDFENIYFFE